MKIEEFEGYLVINENDLDIEVSHQPQLYWKVAKEYTEALVIKAAAKSALDHIDARLDIEMRGKLEAANKKYTEAVIKNAVILDPLHEQAALEFADAAAQAALLEELRESFKQRSSMLKELSRLYVAEYFETDSVKPTAVTDDAVYKKRRERLGRHDSGV